MHPGDPLVIVGEDALRPEGGDDRRLDSLCQVKDRSGSIHGPETREDHRPCGAVDRLRRRPDCLVGRRNPDRREAGLALAVGRVKRRCLDVVWDGELGDTTGDDGVAQCPGEEFDRHRRVGDGVVEDCDGPEERVLIDLLDAAGTGVLRLYLPVEREHACPVLLCVVEPGGEIRGTRPGDGQADCDLSRELVVGRCRHSRGLLVPGDDVPGVWVPPDRIHERERRGSRDAEVQGDPPGLQFRDQHVGHGRDRLFRGNLPHFSPPPLR